MYGRPWAKIWERYALGRANRLTMAVFDFFKAA
jgi:hypothetical protein